MVDMADLMQVGILEAELTAITQALDIADPRITRMTWATPADHVPGVAVTLSTGFIETPPQMMTAIRAALQARADAINSALAGMGVTGVEPQPRASASAATAPPAKKRR